MEKLIIPAHIYDEMIAYCKEKYPIEACGILAGRGNQVLEIYKMTNIENSPVSYFMDPKEQFKTMKDMRDKNLLMLSIFHSHPMATAYPSAKDVSLAFYEDVVYIIVSFLEKEPITKGFLIKEKEIKEVNIERVV